MGTFSSIVGTSGSGSGLCVRERTIVCVERAEPTEETRGPCRKEEETEPFLFFSERQSVSMTPPDPQPPAQHHSLSPTSVEEEEDDDLSQMLKNSIQHQHGNSSPCT